MHPFHLTVIRAGHVLHAARTRLEGAPCNAHPHDSETSQRPDRRRAPDLTSRSECTQLSQRCGSWGALKKRREADSRLTKQEQWSNVQDRATGTQEASGAHSRSVSRMLQARASTCAARRICTGALTGQEGLYL